MTGIIPRGQSDIAILALRYMADRENWEEGDDGAIMLRPGRPKKNGIITYSRSLAPWVFAEEALKQSEKVGPAPEGIHPPGRKSPDPLPADSVISWEALWAPVISFAQENSKALGIEWGDSISERVLEILKSTVASPPEIPDNSEPISEAFIHAAMACGFIVGPSGLRRIAGASPVSEGINDEATASFDKALREMTGGRFGIGKVVFDHENKRVHSAATLRVEIAKAIYGEGPGVIHRKPWDELDGTDQGHYLIQADKVLAVMGAL